MKYLHEILTQTAEAFPKRKALEVVNGTSISYLELLQSAKAVKESIVHLSLDGQARIGVLSTKNIEAVIGLLGISLSAATYVPLDAEAPASRNHFIIQNCQLDALLFEKTLLPDFNELKIEAHQVSEVPGLDELVLVNLSISGKDKKDQAEAPAFILYTSGSTGNPKGVKITHQNALSFILWANQTFDLSEKDIFASIAPLHFDLSVFDLYVSLLNGATLQLIDARTARSPRMLSHLIADRKISVLYATPTMLKLMLHYGKLARYNHQSLRYVLFAGEVFPIPALKAIKAAWPQAQFFNLYGPTETNVVTWFKIPDQIGDREAPFPIGKACSFAQLKVVGKQGNESEGELWVSGQSVSPGYVGQPANGKQHAFCEMQDGTRWYKTGDWVSLEEDGNLSFVGRKDRMVKRRGYRIELAEIEKALHQHPALLAAAVIAQTKEEETEIIAFYQKKADAAETEIDLINLQQFVLKFIPKYMLPDHFIVIDQIPQTSTQKVDYKKLQTR